MGSTFNPQILMEKLAKLNSSQQSIETLSHWCIFHMHKAKQVVETWDRQFHSSPREQRLAFLYLANDILQNSRRKGSEFVGEFWKFLPDALRDVIKNGDEFAKSAALRLISIWEERKVFGSRGQILKEEIIGRNIENNNNNDNTITTRNGKSLGGFKLKNSAGNALEKIVSGYQVVYGQLDEDSLLTKCRNTVSCVEKVDKDINSGQFNGSAMAEELKGQDDKLRECIEQLTPLESSRANLVSNLREALQEQELKLDEVRSQLQAAKSRSERAGNILMQLSPQDQTTTTTSSDNGITEPPAHPYISENTVPVLYTRQQLSSSRVEEDPKSAAAAIAAKLTASTSSVETLSYVLSSLVSEGVIGNSTKQSSPPPPSTEYHSDIKRPKLETDHSSAYIPPTIQLPPTNEQPPPPSSPPPQPPLPPVAAAYPQFPNAGVPYGYGTTQQLSPLQPPLFTATSSSSTATTYQSTYQTEGGFYSQPSATITRQ